jgi:hypothetical protein
MEKKYEVYICDDGNIVITVKKTNHLFICGRVGSVALRFLNKHASECEFTSEYSEDEEEDDE